MNNRQPLVPRSLQAILEVFAAGLLTASVVFDLVELFAPSPLWAEVARWNIEAGIAVGVVAAGLAVVTHLRIRLASRASRMSLAHVFMSFVGIALFGGSLAIRSLNRPESWAIGASFVAFAALLVSTWMGSELRDVGIERSAAL